MNKTNISKIRPASIRLSITEKGESCFQAFLILNITQRSIDA